MTLGPGARAGTAPSTSVLHRLVVVCGRTAIASTLSMVMTASALAQSSSCEDFKAVLAARIEATGVRGYSLETLPASAPAPSDAKMIGTCESGAYKIIYHRWGVARAASAATSSPAATPRSAARASNAASAAQAPAQHPVAAPASSASLVAADRRIERAVVEQLPPAKDDDAMRTAPPLARRALDFAAAHWPWIGVLVLLLVAGRVWRAYLSPYDKDGLPRGPRL